MSIKLTWFGHATLGLDVDGHTLVIDPFFTGNPAASTTADKVNPEYILISHGHGDHMADAVPLAKRTGALVISNFEICGWLQSKGIDNVHSQHIGGGFNYPFGYVKLTHAEHGSAMPDGSEGGNPAGFLITTKDGKKIYLAGDTGLFGDMKLLGEEGIDLAAIPIGDNFTMGPDDALRAVKLLNPRQVIPIHFNTFDVIRQDPQAWKTKVEAETQTRVHVLKPGESYTLD
jgi:L-ascorbate metabolism protein UlaG (beta-lactamase superfamily)